MRQAFQRQRMTAGGQKRGQEGRGCILTPRLLGRRSGEGHAEWWMGESQRRDRPSLRHSRRRGF